MVLEAIRISGSSGPRPELAPAAVALEEPPVALGPGGSIVMGNRANSSTGGAEATVESSQRRLGDGEHEAEPPLCKVSEE